MKKSDIREDATYSGHRGQSARFVVRINTFGDIEWQSWMRPAMTLINQGRCSLTTFARWAKAQIG